MKLMRKPRPFTRSPISRRTALGCALAGRAGVSRWLGALLAGLTLFGVPPAGAAEPAVSKEYQIKAAFLYNFTKFVEWPAERFADETSPIVIGVLGRNPFGSELVNIVRDRKVNGRSIAIVQLETADDALQAHAVFIAAGEETVVETKIETLIRGGVLVVGESPRSLALGSIVVFTTEGDRVRFTINIAAAELDGLKLSAQLLKLATVVRR